MMGIMVTVYPQCLLGVCEGLAPLVSAARLSIFPSQQAAPGWRGGATFPGALPGPPATPSQVRMRL